MSQSVAVALEPFKTQFIKTVADLHNAVKKNDRSQFVPCVQSAEKATDDVVREIRRICQTLTDPSAKHTLVHQGQQISLRIATLKVAAEVREETKEESFFTLLTNKWNFSK